MNLKQFHKNMTDDDGKKLDNYCIVVLLIIIFIIGIIVWFTM